MALTKNTYNLLARQKQSLNLGKRHKAREPEMRKNPTAQTISYHASQKKRTSCITTRTFEAETEPRDTCVEASMLLSVAYTSAHFTPSLDTDTAKDFAGNSQDKSRDSSLCCPPRSTVSVTGSVGSISLASSMELHKMQISYLESLRSARPKCIGTPIDCHARTMRPDIGGATCRNRRLRSDVGASC
jgi:hypothetical protein